jgi:predicted GNAT family acetyltransferase
MTGEEPLTTWARIAAYRHATGKKIVGVILACTPDAVTELAEPPEVSVVTVDAASPVDDIRENMNTNAQGFYPAAPAATPAAAEEFRSKLAGGCAVTVRWSGRSVSAGMVLPVRDGVTELVGIATLQRYRRRGFATVTTAALARIAFTMGADLAFLSTGHTGARRVYERVGFRTVSAPG